MGKTKVREQVFLQKWRIDKFPQVIDIHKQIKTCVNKIEKNYLLQKA